LIDATMKQMAIELIDEAIQAGARQHKACEVLGITCRTLRRWRVAQSLVDRRKGAHKQCPHALSDEDKQRIVATCNQPEHQSLPPPQIVPRLADQGIYIASESSFYRVLREQAQVNRRGRAQASKKRNKPAAAAADAPNRVWSWDITYLPTAIKGQFHRLYLVMDIYSRLIVGWEIYCDELSSHAADLITKACLHQHVCRDQLILHSDNGSPMKGATMLATLQKLGVVPSFSRPSVSDDNPYSEALFRTLKYTPAYPAKPFADLDQARQWVDRFVTWYNTEHRHSGIRFVTPAQRHAGEDTTILALRAAVYEDAKQTHPDRWRGRAIRNWEPVGTVWLNPDRGRKTPAESQPIAA
jgi:putative transposase